MNPENKNKYSIAAPVCSLQEVEPILKSGANEVYFGLMTNQWKKTYGDAEFLTRRQSAHAHFSFYSQLSALTQMVSHYNASATLVLNAQYSENQLPYIMEIISEWEARGGTSIMVDDIGILLQLIKECSRLIRYLSVMAGVFNHETVSFFQSLKVSRIVLPREMKLEEMEALVKNSSHSVAFEVIAMFQKCQYIDSYCHFIHAVDDSSFHPPANQNGNKSLSLCHGCRLPFSYSGKNVEPLVMNDFNTPHCAACQLESLLRNNIRHFKIAGRGYPLEMILKAVIFLKKVLDYYQYSPENIKKEYKSSFGEYCGSKFCYYL